jgi:membrane protease subunit (stomatin/prohibitin family)
MLLKEVVLRRQDAFDQTVTSWANNNNLDIKQYDGSVSLYESADAVVVYHEDYTISKENEGIVDLFNDNGKFTRQVDINGTLIASVSSFIFWLENHKPNNLLFVGDDKLAKNEKFLKFLDQVASRL